MSDDATLRAAVAQVTLPGRSAGGTAFVDAPQTLLTAWHVVQPAASGGTILVELAGAARYQATIADHEEQLD